VFNSPLNNRACPTYYGPWWFYEDQRCYNEFLTGKYSQRPVDSPSHWIGIGIVVKSYMLFRCWWGVQSSPWLSSTPPWISLGEDFRKRTKLIKNKIRISWLKSLLSTTKLSYFWFLWKVRKNKDSLISEKVFCKRKES